jgi:hypothetical protein
LIKFQPFQFLPNINRFALFLQHSIELINNFKGTQILISFYDDVFIFLI